MKATTFFPTRFFYILLAASLASCGALQETAYAPDDVYYTTESDYPTLTAQSESENGDSRDTNNSEEDEYYNVQESRRATSRDYYDVTYRDPHYFRYGRFGFNNARFGMSMNNGGWGMGFGNAGWGMGMRPGGFFNTGNYWGGGSSFYGYDPFTNSSFYYNNPWASPYSNGAWGNNFYGGYSPNWMNPGNFYGAYGNPYMGFYDPAFGYYGYGGYCPSNFLPAASNAVHYGHRNSLNSVNTGTSNIGTPRIGRQGSVNLLNDVAQNMERERTQERQKSQDSRVRELPREVTLRPSKARDNNRANSRNRDNSRLNAPNRNDTPSRSRVNSGSRSNSRGANRSGGSNRGSRSGGRR